MARAVLPEAGACGPARFRSRRKGVGKHRVDFGDRPAAAVLRKPPAARLETGTPGGRRRISRHRERGGPHPRLPGEGGRPLPGHRPPPRGIHGRPGPGGAGPPGSDPRNGRPEKAGAGVGRRPPRRFRPPRFRRDRDRDRRGRRRSPPDGGAACGHRISGRRPLRLCRPLRRPGTEEGHRPPLRGGPHRRLPRRPLREPRPHPPLRPRRNPEGDDPAGRARPPSRSETKGVMSL